MDSSTDYFQPLFDLIPSDSAENLPSSSQQFAFGDFIEQEEWQALKNESFDKEDRIRFPENLPRRKSKTPNSGIEWEEVTSAEQLPSDRLFVRFQM